MIKKKKYSSFQKMKKREIYRGRNTMCEGVLNEEDIYTAVEKLAGSSS